MTATAQSGTPVPSPCINVCRMAGQPPWCEGCLRTLDEIACWGSLSDEGKRQVWEQLALRRASLEPTNAAP